MRTITWILVTLVVVPVVGAETLEFGSAATFSADDLGARGAWLIVYYSPADRGAFQMVQSSPGTSAEAEHHRLRVTGPDGFSYAYGTPWRGGPDLGPGTIEFLTKNDWGALYVYGEEIQLLATNQTGILRALGPTDCLHHVQSKDDLKRDLLPYFCPPGRVFMQANVNTSAIDSSVSFHVVNATRMIVHNFRTSCSGDSCPEGGYRQQETQSSPLSFEAQVWRYGYERYELSGATVSGSAGTHGTYLGGSALDLGFTGSARFPLANGTSCLAGAVCSATGDQTLRVWGTLALDDLHATGDSSSRLRATVSGDADLIMLDEAPFFSSGTQKIAAAAGVAALLAAAVKIALGVLATRTKHDPLAHPNRKKLYNYILTHPGGTFREVIRGTEIPAGTARHHLAILRQTNLIQEHGHKATLRYFENHGRFDDSWNTVVMLREPELKRLHKWLLKHPGSMQREILDAAGTDWGWSRSTTQHRLKRLSEEGLIDVKLQGRLKLYTARQRAPVPA